VLLGELRMVQVYAWVEKFQRLLCMVLNAIEGIVNSFEGGNKWLSISIQTIRGSHIEMRKLFLKGVQRNSPRMRLVS